jgi:Phage terminase large subunit
VALAPSAWSMQALVDCPLEEVFFGGARGGGKTDGVLGKWAIKERRYGKHFNAIMFRRTTVSAEDAIERSKQIYGPLGGKFNESKLRWRMPNGGRVSFAYLENLKDADAYQGRNVTDAWVEEAGQFPTAMPIVRLFGVLRSAAGVPVQLILTANPGGAGQHWIRERYSLHPFPMGPKIRTLLLANGATHKIAVIPSRIENNRYLGQDYVNRLHMVGSAQLVKAWLKGDWTAIEGAFFDCWDESVHVITPFAIPDDWLRFRSGDWGSASPYSIGWWAVVTDDYALPDLSGGGSGLEWRDNPAPDLSGRGARTLPRGALVRYREDYGKVGGKLTAEQVGDRIVKAELGDIKLTYGVLDPSTFKEDGGPSIAERINGRLLAKRMAPFREADNTRVTRQQSPDKRGAMGGWDQMRARLIGTARQGSAGLIDWSTGRPMAYCFSTCTDSIRTIPVCSTIRTSRKILTLSPKITPRTTGDTPAARAHGSARRARGRRTTNDPRLPRSIGP